MLKHLDKWLDDLNEFADKHYDFCFAIKGICVGVLGIGILAAFFAAIFFTSPDSSKVKWEGDLQMSDTRIVHCIATKDGLSCDWNHASGADKR